MLPFGRPGGDLLSHVLGRSTIGAEGFHGRVRDGIGCFAPRYGHQAFQKAEDGGWVLDRCGGRASEPCLFSREASCACVPAERCSAAKEGLPPSFPISVI